MSAMSRRRALGLTAGLATLAFGAVTGVGCTPSDAAVDPVWGKEPCAHCHMLVSDRRFAAQVVHDGERRYFDDVGCMVLWMNERHPAWAREWVYDAPRSAWTAASTSAFARGAKTPMDFGFEARSDGAVTYAAMRDAVLASAKKEERAR